LKQVGQVESFDPGFAAPGDWAAMYRAAGLQVVPSYAPSSGPNWKRPALADWKSLQEELVPDAAFERWYGSRGEHTQRGNMGILTGRASGNVFVVDLDEYKTPDALNWWRGVMAEHNNDMELETCQQVTGGGGRQLFFIAPAGWHAPTNKTPIGVDIRGQGGFAVLPPSQHSSGTPYAWKAGNAPWECEIAAAPDWLLQAVLDLVESYGGDQHRQMTLGQSSGPVVSTASPAEDFNAFGQRVDGRDHAMRDLVWAAVVNWYRECPIPPSDAESQTRAREVWAVYERKNKTRLPGDNVAGLEKEGRGPTLFADKWRRAMGKWSTEIAEAAQRPLADDEWRDATQEQPSTGGAASRGRFVFEKIGDLRKLPPAQWLVKDWVPEGATGIFYGKWAAGKSFIGFDLALHLAYGMTDWHGAALPGTPCHVLIIAREGHQGFVNRIDAFKKHHGLVDDDDHITFMRGSVSFMRDEDFAALVDAIKTDATPYQLVIVDTVARVLPGVDMNEQQTVTMFMERIGIIGTLTGASTIGVHHQNKSGGMMGSTFFEANADFVFEVSREGEEDGPLTAGEIVCTKMKDGEDRWKRSVSYSKIALSVLPDGPASLVVDRIGSTPPARPQGNGWPDKEVCRRVLHAIGEAWIAGKPWSHSPQSPDRFAPKMMAQRFEVSAKTAKDMLEKWLLNDVISIEIRDAHSKQKGLKVIGSID
jgi:hypothetical protein